MALINEYNKPENRRRRDERGRYMERGGNYDRRSEYDEGYDDYYDDRQGHYEPYEMPMDRRRMGFARYGDRREVRGYSRRRMTVLPQYRYGLPFEADEEREHERMRDMQEHHKRQKMDEEHHDHHGEEVEPLTLETAKEWVRSMCNTDPNRPEGECWTMDEVKEIVRSMGMPMTEKKLIEFYAVINAMYSDYYKVAEKFDLVEDDFFACLAKAFIEDEDAVKDKAAAYYQYIVKKE